jgi:hypothetical protein
MLRGRRAVKVRAVLKVLARGLWIWFILTALQPYRTQLTHSSGKQTSFSHRLTEASLCLYSSDFKVSTSTNKPRINAQSEFRYASKQSHHIQTSTRSTSNENPIWNSNGTEYTQSKRLYRPRQILLSLAYGLVKFSCLKPKAHRQLPKRRTRQKNLAPNAQNDPHAA